MAKLRINNQSRSARVDKTLEFYVRKQLGESYNPDGMEEDLVDLLTDTMHFAAAKEIDFESILRMARSNFEAEKDETKANCGICSYLGKDCNPDEDEFELPCSEFTPCCQFCTGKLELQRTEVILGVSREIYSCVDCDLPYIKDTSDPDGKIEYAVPCIMCHNVWPKTSSHIFHESDGFGHFIGGCCWEDHLWLTS